jgi:hypothetical protein
MAEDTKLRFPRADTSYSSGDVTRADRGPGDPLAELARLIGQDQGFSHNRRDAAHMDVARAPAFPASEQIEAASRRLTRGVEPRSMSEGMEMRRATPTLQPVAAYPDPATAVHASARAVEQPSYNYDPHYTDPQTDYATDVQSGSPEPYYEGAADPNADAGYDYSDGDLGPLPKEKRRGGMMTVAVVLGLAAMGTAGAFGYRAFVGGKSGPPPVITADRSPAKVAPAPAKNDGQGSRVIYDRAEKQQPERIVTREEQPIEMKEAKPSTQRMAFPPVGATVSPVQAAAPLTPPATGNPSEPKKVRTVAIRPDGTVIPDSARAQPAVDTRGIAANVARLPAARPAAPGTTAPQPASTGPVALAPSTTSPRAGEPTQTASVAPAGTHVVQLASQRSEAEAQASFRVLQAKYSNVLGSLQPIIQRVDLGGTRGTHFRAQVGPFASVEQANELCTNLKAAGGQCFVRRN